MKRMFLIDGSNHAFRVQFALPPRHASDGTPTRVLYGFTLLMQKLMRTWKPDYVVVSFDVGKNFRSDIFSEYKGHRPEMPEDLKVQWPMLPELVEAFGYRCINMKGWEADDVLGTLAHKYAGEDLEVFFVTSDKDFSQLVSDHVKILDEGKGTILDPEGVAEKFHGVRPDQIIDMLALAGDSSDNIPGVAGIGLKTAAKYLSQYEHLEDVLKAAADGKIKGKRGQSLVDEADNARLSYTLATIATDVPIDDALEDLAPREPDTDKLRELFDKWEFGRVARKLLGDGAKVDWADHEVVEAGKEGKLYDAVRKEGTLAWQPRFDDDGALIGVAISRKGKASYVPLAPAEGEGQLFADDSARKGFLALLADPQVTKIGYGLKAQMRHLGVDAFAGPMQDVRLQDYILFSHRRTHGLDDQASRLLSHTLGSSSAAADDPDLALIAEEANCLAAIFAKNDERLEGGMRWVYDHIEMPLMPVLARMEAAGIALDTKALKVVDKEIAGRLKAVEKECHELAGKEFRLRSRHELRDVLFEDLGLPPSKKVKDGWSTASGVLEKLIDLHPLPGKVLEYRALDKLRSTYLKKLPSYVAEDGRIHSTFNQAVAATGRLSSVDPNLQNIPVRTVTGRRIREAFVPAEGTVFLSADYSQVELRVLAHFTEDPVLMQAFENGEDIHQRTALEIFGLDPSELTVAHRSAAKAINFGLLYGMSAFRLAGDLDVPQSQAQAYMDAYFARMPSVKGWIEQTKESARETGHVDTLFGRRRIIPEIHAPAFNERMAGEREAVNTVIQGTAADLIKLAMLRVQGALDASDLKARVLLQVHDELLLEVPENEVDAVTKLVTEEMTGVKGLKVPLMVNTAVGSNWNEAHG